MHADFECYCQQVLKGVPSSLTKCTHREQHGKARSGSSATPITAKGTATEDQKTPGLLDDVLSTATSSQAPSAKMKLCFGSHASKDQERSQHAQRSGKAKQGKCSTPATTRRTKRTKTNRRRAGKDNFRHTIHRVTLPVPNNASLVERAKLNRRECTYITTTE
jgi:hypothetical protein